MASMGGCLRAAAAALLLLAAACGDDGPTPVAPAAPLVVTRTVPWPGATHVPVDVVIEIVFQRDVRAGEIPAGAFRLDDAPLPVRDVAGRSVTLQPSPPLAVNRIYRVSLHRDAWGGAPGRPEADHAWSFTTEAGPPGLTWSADDAGTAAHLRSISGSRDGVYIAGDAATLLFGTTGGRWSRRTYSVPAADLARVRRRGGVDLLFDAGGGVWVSRDGVSWRAWGPPGVAGFAALAADVGPIWVLGGLVADGTDRGALVRFDGTTSTLATFGPGQHAVDVFWAGFDAQWVAVLEPGIAVVSPDGSTWTGGTMPAGVRALRAVAGRAGGGGGPQRYVAVGTEILWSEDGRVWTLAALAPAVLHDVAWTGACFVAVGDGGAVVSSEDGVLWTRHDAGTTVTLRGIAATDPARWTAAGDGGTILTTPARTPRGAPAR